MLVFEEFEAFQVLLSDSCFNERFAQFLDDAPHSERTERYPCEGKYPSEQPAVKHAAYRLHRGYYSNYHLQSLYR